MEKKLLPLAAFLLFLSISAFSQPVDSSIIQDDAEYRSIRRFFLSRSSNLGSIVSLLENNHIVLDQGKVGTCGGYAIAHSVGIWIQKYCNKKFTRNDSMPVFSGLYLCCKTNFSLPYDGYTMGTLLNALQENGIPLEKFYRNNPRGCPEKLNATIDLEAAKYRLWNYASIFGLTSDMCPNSKDTACIRQAEKEMYEGVVSAIDKHLPVILVMELTPEFKSLNKDACTISQKTNATAKYHAVVVTGYDDQKREFQILNSYGENWGCGGLVYIHYDVFGKLARYGYVFELKKVYGLKVPCDH